MATPRQPSRGRGSVRSQWVAQSPIRPHHKRKNWFIGVFELPALPDAPKALAVQDVRF